MQNPAYSTEPVRKGVNKRLVATGGFVMLFVTAFGWSPLEGSIDVAPVL